MNSPAVFGLILPHLVLRDPVVIEQFFKNGIRGDEERLMLAVLQDAVECFQEYVLAQYPWVAAL